MITVGELPVYQDLYSVDSMNARRFISGNDMISKLAYVRCVQSQCIIEHRLQTIRVQSTVLSMLMSISLVM